MLKDLDIAPKDPAEMRAVNRLLANEVKALTLKVEQLQHQLAGHNRHRFGSKSESLDQLNLVFQEDEEIAEAAEDRWHPLRSLRRANRPASTAASLYPIIWTGTKRSCPPARTAATAAGR